MALISSSIALVLGFAAYWAMPVFAPAGLVFAMTSALLVVTGATWGAPKTASLALYFCVAANVPFFAQRTSTFYFEQGYLSLAYAGILFGAVLFLIDAKISLQRKRPSFVDAQEGADA